MKKDNNTFLYAEVYVKETESDDNLVDYIIFHGITNDVNIALEKTCIPG